VFAFVEYVTGMLRLECVRAKNVLRALATNGCGDQQNTLKIVILEKSLNQSYLIFVVN